MWFGAIWIRLISWKRYKAAAHCKPFSQELMMAPKVTTWLLASISLKDVRQRSWIKCIAFVWREETKEKPRGRGSNWGNGPTQVVHTIKIKRYSWSIVNQPFQGWQLWPMPMLNHISSSIRHHLCSLHLLEDIQGHLPLEGLLAGTDQGTVGDDVGDMESTPRWAKGSKKIKSSKTTTNIIFYDLMIFVFYKLGCTWISPVYMFYDDLMIVDRPFLSKKHINQLAAFHRRSAEPSAIACPSHKHWSQNCSTPHLEWSRPKACLERAAMPDATDVRTSRRNWWWSYNWWDLDPKNGRQFDEERLKPCPIARISRRNWSWHWTWSHLPSANSSSYHYRVGWPTASWNPAHMPPWRHCSWSSEAFSAWPASPERVLEPSPTADRVPTQSYLVVYD